MENCQVLSDGNYYFITFSICILVKNGALQTDKMWIVRILLTCLLGIGSICGVTMWFNVTWIEEVMGRPI